MIDISILNDDRRYSTNEEEYEEWKSEMLAEFRRQENADKEMENRFYEQDMDDE